MFTIELGSRVISDVSGYKGIVVSRAEHLNGCNRYWVAPPVDKNGKFEEGYWFDEIELKVLSKPKPKRKKKNDDGWMPSRMK